jgi:hypothetical protein
MVCCWDIHTHVNRKYVRGPFEHFRLSELDGREQLGIPCPCGIVASISLVTNVYHLRMFVGVGGAIVATLT